MKKTSKTQNKNPQTPLEWNEFFRSQQIKKHEEASKNIMPIDTFALQKVFLPILMQPENKIACLMTLLELIDHSFELSISGDKVEATHNQLPVKFVYSIDLISLKLNIAAEYQFGSATCLMHKSITINTLFKEAFIYMTQIMLIQISTEIKHVKR